jgi:hypothetical protein
MSGPGYFEQVRLACAGSARTGAYGMTHVDRADLEKAGDTKPTVLQGAAAASGRAL